MMSELRTIVSKLHSAIELSSTIYIYEGAIMTGTHAMASCHQKSGFADVACKPAA